MDKILKGLLVKNNSKIILLVMDGLGGIPLERGGETALEAASTPNIDHLAGLSSCGLLDPVYPGITPGSGPSHLALFGYDPVKFNIGRGVLSALGIDFPIQHGDICARVNFATIDRDDTILDRRAGRIPTELNARLCKLISEKVNPPVGVKFFISPEKEHRAAIVLRGEGLSDKLTDTDPQKEGLKVLPVNPVFPEAEKTAQIMNNLISQIKEILKEQPKANMILVRGFAKYHAYPTMEERFGLKSCAIAEYPMYRGLAKLVGMKVVEVPEGIKGVVDVLKKYYDKFDFFYLHIKKTDSYGEDGNFSGKVGQIEEVDSIIPDILSLNPDVLVITADHSTACKLRSHSWHPVPVLLYSAYCRQDRLNGFDEMNCRFGSLGRLPSVALMPLILANALRLKKFGA